jgi:hypothetical protein
VRTRAQDSVQARRAHRCQSGFFLSRLGELADGHAGEVAYVLRHLPDRLAHALGGDRSIGRRVARQERAVPAEVGQGGGTGQSRGFARAERHLSHKRACARFAWGAHTGRARPWPALRHGARGRRFSVQASGAPTSRRRCRSPAPHPCSALRTPGPRPASTPQLPC